MRLGVLALAAIAAAGGVLVSCTTTCAIPECAEPLRVELSSRCWPDGAYVVSGTIDGEAFQVELELPVVGGGASSADGRIVVQASNTRGLEAVVAYATPASLTLDVRRGEVPLGSEVYSSISYVENRYGGDGCEEGSCPTARMDWYADDAAIARLCAVSPAGAP